VVAAAAALRNERARIGDCEKNGKGRQAPTFLCRVVENHQRKEREEVWPGAKFPHNNAGLWFPFFLRNSWINYLTSFLQYKLSPCIITSMWRRLQIQFWEQIFSELVCLEYLLKMKTFPLTPYCFPIEERFPHTFCWRRKLLSFLFLFFPFSRSFSQLFAYRALSRFRIPSKERASLDLDHKQGTKFSLQYRFQSKICSFQKRISHCHG